MIDPYSFTHVLHGVIFQLISSRTIPSIPCGFLGCMLFEIGWELLENSEFVMRRFRENSGTSGQYHGDSVQNIFGDLLSCASGFYMGTVFQRTGVWWGSLLWIALSEVRFSECMNVKNLFPHLKGWLCGLREGQSCCHCLCSLSYKSEAFVDWQVEGLHSDGLEGDVKEE